jgi:hypothetical protein
MAPGHEALDARPLDSNRLGKRPGIRFEVGRGRVVALDRHHLVAAARSETEREETDARIEVDDRAGPTRGHHSRHQFVEEIPVALEERPAVPAQPHTQHHVLHVRLPEDAARRPASGIGPRQPGHAVDPLERRDRCAHRPSDQLDVHRALPARPVFGELDVGVPGEPGRRQAARKVADGPDGLRQELPRHPGIAHLVRALEEEPGTAASQVKAGAHPIARLGRRHDCDESLDRDPADPGQGVPDDFALQPPLLLVRDVREYRTAAARVEVHGAARRMRLDDFHDARERKRPLDPLDARAHPFARNGPRHAHDHPLVARQHAAAGGRLVRNERDEVVRAYHKASTSPG